MRSPRVDGEPGGSTEPGQQLRLAGAGQAGAAVALETLLGLPAQSRHHRVRERARREPGAPGTVQVFPGRLRDRGATSYRLERFAARAFARARFSSASRRAASSYVGAVPLYDAGSHHEPGGCSSAG